MAEIGDSLREARMRAGVDISDIEAETKIRAKYLRALENEEWSLLPGPTFVKSFLRTYADAVGLDGRLLVENYKQRHENLSDVELQPITPPGQRDRRPPPRLRRGPVIALAVAVLVGALYLLGSGGDSGGGGRKTAKTVPERRTPTTARTTTTPKRTRPGVVRPAKVSLQFLPTGPVSICLTAGGRVLIPSATLTAPSRVFRARRFKVTLGNGSVVMKIGGRSLQVPEIAAGIGYVITPNGRRVLSAGQRPTCGA